MKLKALILAVILTASFGNVLFAEEGCSSCVDAAKSATEAKTADVKSTESCPDGVCSATDGHNHKEAAAPAHTEEKADAPATINTLGLKTLINSKVPLIVLDARSGEFDDGKRLPGALSLNADSKAEDIAKALPSKEALIVTYCSNLKCPASHKLYTHLQSLGYTNLIEYPEGIQGWVEAGNPVTSSK